MARNASRTQSVAGAFLLAGCSASLTIGALDTLLALSANSSGFPSFSSLFPSLGLLVALTFAGWAGLSVMLGIVLRSSIRPRALSWAAALECSVVVLFTMLWLAGLNAVSSFTGDFRNAIVKAFLVACVSGAAALGAFFVAGRWEVSARGRGRVRFLMALVPLSLTTLAVLSCAGFTQAVPWSAAGAMAAALLAVSCAVSYLFRHSPALSAVMALSLAIVICTPAVSFVQARAGRPGTPPHSRSGHTVPRVILITVDALRRDSVNCFSPGGNLTPHIDAFAKDCLLFKNAYTPSPWTVPSFVSLMTGVDAAVHGVNEYFAPIPSRYTTLAERMREAGYLTGAVGHQPQLLRMGRGFDDFDFYPKRLPYNGDTTAGKLLWRIFREESPTHKLTNNACRWFASHKDEDFFFWIHYLDPHTPYAPPAEYIPDSPMRARMGVEFGGSASTVRGGNRCKTQAERDWVKALYDAEVRYVDDNIGRLLDQLRAQGLYDDALIILTTDHGEEFWDHGSFEHGHTLYNELVTSPMLIKLPGAKAKGRVEAAVSNGALAPTLLDLCGVAYDAGAFTRPSFAALLGGSGGYTPAPVFIGATEYYEPREAVVFDRFKLIHAPDSGANLLFDIEEDPGEHHSVVVTEPERTATGLRLIEEVTAGAGEGGGEDSGEGAKDAFIEGELGALGYL
ncbi:MAG: sulfatase-like hydrolase/transferase [Nitrospiraceae bacterium]|nr:sulfatase-like hydrolase/transferase [Nitrospiraceae bacterium]